MVGVESSLEPGTADVYRMHVEHYIIPRLGSEPIRELTPPKLTRFYSDLRKSGGKRGPAARAPNREEHPRHRRPR